MIRTLKVLVAAGLIVLLARAVEWDELRVHLDRLQWWAVFLAIAGYAVQFFISGWKWLQALRVLGTQLPLGLLVRLYCIGHFVGQFLPSAIGGDAYRIYRTVTLIQPRSRAVSAVVVERIVGFAVLLLMGGIGALTVASQYVMARTYLLLLGAGIVAAAVAFLTMRAGGLEWLTARLQSFKLFQVLRENYRQLETAGGAWLPLLGASVVFQGVAIGIIYVLFLGIQADVTLFECALIGALAGAATILPISINGIGVVEGALAGTAVALGVQYEHALVVAVLTRVLVVPLSLACGVIYMLEPRRPPDADQPS